jgi:uncharacterized coiled-coil protein SlyX
MENEKVTNELIYEVLKKMQSDIAAIKEDSREIKSRVTSLESGQAMVLQHLGHMSGDIAEQHTRYDRLAERIQRLEKRLEIAE